MWPPEPNIWAAAGISLRTIQADEPVRSGMADRLQLAGIGISGQEFPVVAYLPNRQPLGRAMVICRFPLLVRPDGSGNPPGCVADPVSASCTRERVLPNLRLRPPRHARPMSRMRNGPADYGFVLNISRYGTAEMPVASLKLLKLLLFSQIAYVLPGCNFTGRTQVRWSLR